ncbi:MAG: c-type cytochrome [Opitutaceae bacterium]|nr:c-type cytochrome [Opitutaceae bacterium]
MKTNRCYCITLIRNYLLALGLTVLLPAAHAQVNADAAKTLATKHLCLACHQLEGKLVGPAYRDVANKYRGVPDAQAKLIAKIKKGGQGVWGQVPMPPMYVPDENLKTIVAWILGSAAPVTVASAPVVAKK